MSVRLIGDVLRTPLSTSQKMVLLVLADAASEDGVAWPRQSTISTRSSMTDRSVRRILDDLRSVGLVSWEQRGLRKSNLYRIDVDRLRTIAELGDGFDLEESGSDIVSGPDSPDRTEESGPERTSASGLERTSASGPIGTVRGTVRTEPSTRRDELFERLCEVCGIDWTAKMTKTQRGRINAAVKEIREIGGTADEILRVATAYRLRWPTIDVTPQGIVGNWNLVRAPLPNDESVARVRRRLLTPPGEREGTESRLESETAGRRLPRPREEDV